MPSKYRESLYLSFKNRSLPDDMGRLASVQQTATVFTPVTQSVAAQEDMDRKTEENVNKIRTRH